ncbi:hypothetical protein KRMM14A1004_05170 [Krasilnikovia sp. MM14-A1004]
MSPGVASAASEQSFQSDALRNSTYLASMGRNHAAGVESLFGRATSWSVEDKGTINGHHKVRLVDASRVPSDGCLDSHAEVNGGHPYVIACNSGDYQIWEVFKTGDYVVFKSYGAYTQQHVHVCVKAPTGLRADHTNTVLLATCDTNSRYQRWF